MFLGDVYFNRSKLVESSKGPRGSNGAKMCLLSQAAALLPGAAAVIFISTLNCSLICLAEEEGTRPVQRMRPVGAGDLRCSVRGLGWFSAKSLPEEWWAPDTAVFTPSQPSPAGVGQHGGLSKLDWRVGSCKTSDIRSYQQSSVGKWELSYQTQRSDSFSVSVSISNKPAWLWQLSLANFHIWQIFQ